LAIVYGPKRADAVTEYSVSPAQSTVYIAGIELSTAEITLPIFYPTPEQVKEEIERQAALYGVNVKTALRIARCESTYVYNAKSRISTAKGVYQFIDGTWQWIGADGHQFDYKENIKQFMIWYPKFPQWWECK